MDLSIRSTLPELMDEPDFSLADYQACLRDLAAVNRITLTHRPALKFLDRATSNWPRGAKISVLDLAFGHGDLLRAIAQWAAKRGFNAQLSGVDLNPRSAAAAAQATPANLLITYVTADVFDYIPAEKPDFIVTSQFTHHLPAPDILRLLGWMQTTAKCGWLITDLHRHALAYYGFPILARLCRWHKIVRLDGTVSIARSFRRADWQHYLAASGVKARISWHLMFRYAVSQLK